MKFSVRVHRLADGRFVAVVVELPGCESEPAASVPEAIRWAKAAVLRTLAEGLRDETVQLDGLVFHIEVEQAVTQHCPTVDPVLAAIAKVRERYPDFNDFEVEAGWLGSRFRAQQVGPHAVDLEQYIEGLYILAKFSSFSNSPGRMSDTAWMLAQGRGEQRKSTAVQ